MVVKVKVINEFLGLKKDEVGIITNKEGEILLEPPTSRAMWIKFDSKDMPVGIPEPFGMFVAIIKVE